VIVGVDVGAPRRERDQRRKIIAIAAIPIGPHAYRVDAAGMNARLLSSDAPGWAARELVEQLVAEPARVVGFDAPFGIPHTLLRDPGFSAAIGHEGAFESWRAFNGWVARRLPLRDPLDFAPFSPWREPASRERLWGRRATDLAAGAQPPLKDRFQATFQMTLLCNAMLSRLLGSQRYRVPPLDGGLGGGEAIEVYPGATLRALGMSSYKARPDEAVRRCLDACAAAGIALDVDAGIVSAACRYSSGSSASPDHDIADAFVALCTAVLYAEGACRPAMAPDPSWPEPVVTAWEGAIWVPPVAATPAGQRPARPLVAAGNPR
jgi:hypothetical protein